MALLYQDETAILRRCFFDVQNEVGLGRQERAYQRASELWLGRRGIPYVRKLPHALRVGGQIANVLIPDLVLWNKITVELKAVSRRLRESEYVQIFDYLKCRGDRLGLLVNMGLDRVVVKRLRYDTPSISLEEDWRYWEQGMCGRDRDVGIAVQKGLRSIYQQHGTGYGNENVQKLICTEMTRRGMSLSFAPVAKSFYDGIVVDESPLECVVVEGCILLTMTALFDRNTINIRRGKSYLSALNLNWGIAVNFGKNMVQFSGLHMQQ